MIFEEAVVLSEPFDQVVEQVKGALASQGFGTLTEIDLQATLKEKIGREADRHVILGACNPLLAARALDAEPAVAVLLPCNVCVRETDRGVVVEAMDPGMISTVSGSSELEPIAAEARELINNAFARLT
ncbi:MAG: DUF302 domain-containing protein [Microthrixaceae bacterium]|nr:DUF302 domain-containing protein [Microthrixaceae bacterium]